MLRKYEFQINLKLLMEYEGKGLMIRGGSEKKRWCPGPKNESLVTCPSFTTEIQVFKPKYGIVFKVAFYYSVPRVYLLIYLHRKLNISSVIQHTLVCVWIRYLNSKCSKSQGPLLLLRFLIFVVPCIMLYNFEISPTRSNNCVLFFAMALL